MALKNRFLAKVTTFVAALGFGVVAMLGTTGTAGAATTAFKLCNYGSDYNTQVVFSSPIRPTTPWIGPGQCSGDLFVAQGESFSINLQLRGSVWRYQAATDRTYSSGRTLVQTWGSFGYFQYGKLPY